MIERLREYDAEVSNAAPDELPAAIAAQLAASGKHQLCRPARSSRPTGWSRPPGRSPDWNDIDHGLSTAEIEQAEGVVTAASCGIADSGTIVLHHSATEGRRVLTLLPDWHLCILEPARWWKPCLSTSAAASNPPRWPPGSPVPAPRRTLK